MRALLTAASFALLALPGVAMAQDKPNPAGEAELAKMLEGRIAGAPVNCLSVNRMDNSTIVDGTAIVYRSGSTLYVNRPRAGAERLDSDNILLTKLSGSQLCSVDAVDLLDRSSRSWNGFVSLGQFVPYKLSTASN
ncbi:hypothetical protein P1X14_18445 [Sphingomonas sp. AOB5]|uniref:hypothetical protein n=1 Tax=Sphingomonas sp. AOB5 TaxID=3034017 RepID=UPI0023F9127B|nr:hypothetical protein [Sphingomonas sp. AOB5]MDF7777246.1 hypothetical protein [Sphingomonas sp. AOB5]